MSFEPLKNNILVKRTVESNVSDSGIILATRESTITAFGTVTHVGPECNKVNIGTMVMFNSMINMTIPIDNEPHLFMNEDDIYGILTEGTKLDGANNFKVVHTTDVLIKVQTVVKEVTHVSGIILTAQASALHDRPTKGEVVQIGKEITNISIGDIVEFEKTAGIDLVKDKDDESSHYILMDLDRLVGKYTN
jgi:co-chaperonin GroES (HSP10)